MNWDRVAGVWKQYKGSLRAKWGQLTDDDLDVTAGNRQRLIGKIQERYGIAKGQAEREVREWERESEEERPRRAGGI